MDKHKKDSFFSRNSSWEINCSNNNLKDDSYLYYNFLASFSKNVTILRVKVSSDKKYMIIVLMIITIRSHKTRITRKHFDILIYSIVI